eukprot:c13435_g1_i1 orf=57-245(+)
MEVTVTTMPCNALLAIRFGLRFKKPFLDEKDIGQPQRNGYKTLNVHTTDKESHRRLKTEISV